MDGWNSLVSCWVSDYFQGRLLLVSGRVIRRTLTCPSWKSYLLRIRYSPLLPQQICIICLWLFIWAISGGWSSLQDARSEACIILVTQTVSGKPEIVEKMSGLIPTILKYQLDPTNTHQPRKNVPSLPCWHPRKARALESNTHPILEPKQQIRHPNNPDRFTQRILGVVQWDRWSDAWQKIGLKKKSDIGCFLYGGICWDMSLRSVEMYRNFHPSCQHGCFQK